jgi:Putative adhesin
MVRTGLAPPPSVTLLAVRRHERFEVGDRPRVEVHVPAGSVEVRAGAPSVIEITIDASDPGDFEVDQVGDSVSVRQTSRWRTRSRSVRVTAVVPSGTDVDVTSGSADAHLVGDLGVSRVRTASGDAQVDMVARLDASTASGDIRIGEVSGDAVLSTASGDCTVGTVEGRLGVSTASGDLRADLVGGELQVSTASGNVRVGRCGGGEVAVKTVSGDITVGLPSGIRVDADINTMSGRTRLPDPAAVDPAVPRRPVRLRLRSVSGNIRVERAD